jgi:hypothetical protein
MDLLATSINALKESVKNLYISIYARGFIYNTHKYIKKIEGAINVEKIRENKKF